MKKRNIETNSPKVYNYKRENTVNTPLTQKSISERVLIILLCAVFLFLGTFAGTLISDLNKSKRYSDYEFLYQVADFIQRYYYQDVTTEELVWYASQGMLLGLDNYSSIYVESMGEEDVGYYGFEISYDKCGEFRIEWVDEDSAAEKAGLKIGDYIYSVNGTVVEGDFTSTFTTLMKNKKIGDEVVIRKRAEKNGAISNDITMVAEASKNVLVRGINDFSTLPGDSSGIPQNVGYIKLYKFSDGAVEQMQSAVKEFLEAGKTKLILDLRDNTGGDGDVLSKIAGYFLKNEQKTGEIPVITMQYKDGTKRVHKTGEYNYILDGIEGGEIVVLTNERTASASEGLIGAMVVSGTAELVGTTTYGKGVGQIITSFPNAQNPIFKIKITAGEYFFSGDVSAFVKNANGYVDRINGVGFTPIGENYVIFNRANSLLEDNQFMHAVDLLRS